MSDLDLWLKIGGVLAAAVAWGDLRRQVRGLADEVRKQNGRIGKVEEKSDATAEALAGVRGFLKL